MRENGGKLDPCGGDGKIWEQFLQKAKLGQQGQSKGVKHQVRWSEGALKGPSEVALKGQQVRQSLGHG